MSELAVKVLTNDESVTQKVHIKRLNPLIGLRTHFVKKGILPNGLLTLNVKNGSTVLYTMSHDYAYLNTLGTNWHGMLGFAFNSPLSLSFDGYEYPLTFEFVMSGHTNSDSIYCGLIHETDNTQTLVHDIAADYYADYGIEPSFDIWCNPFRIEIFTIN